ncbi:MAG: response regulator [Phycisphaerales bacterium]|nr:response regulator [Planctomycetota bacterium]MCH8508780.1 response regulator [Phycisphaerales bacterium]
MSNIRTGMIKCQQGQAARNTLGVGGQAYELLLSKLDERQEEGEVDPQRVYTRMPLMDPFVRVQVESDGSSRKEITLACRNLSRGGVGLLHSSFMYPNTPVTVFLNRTDGSSPGIRGKVVRVQHRGGVVHEIGIKFDKEINPRDYVTSDVTEIMPSFERVRAETLSGKVVIVSRNEETRKAIREFLQESELTLGFARNAEEAMIELDKQPDIVLIDIDLGSLSGPELLKKMRGKGYGRPAVLVGDPGDGVTRSLVKVCGADALLRTPLTADGLLCVLGEFLLSGWSIEHLDKARSRVDRPTLVSLCTELGKLGIVLDQQVQRDDRVALFGTCQKIAGVSLMVGMNGVASMAERLAQQAADGVEAIGELVEQVRLGCAAAGKAAA